MYSSRQYSSTITMQTQHWRRHLAPGSFSISQRTRLTRSSARKTVSKRFAFVEGIFHLDIDVRNVRRFVPALARLVPQNPAKPATPQRNLKVSSRLKPKLKLV